VARARGAAAAGAGRLHDARAAARARRRRRRPGPLRRVYERAGARIVVEPAGAGAVTARVRALWASLDPDPPPVPLRPVAPDLFRISLPASKQDAGAAFLDPTGRGAPSLLLLGGRAHPRISGSPPG
jgi:hypothetical protein